MASLLLNPGTYGLKARRRDGRERGRIATGIAIT
jgi:hypothetical protein